ncbi:protein of unknown function [Taphrina deformans PYCC 5710]|uniref:Uncharacterized protein n=1 Tax=Taphrina deformans (strain PYCC 5710 / ATCC 11124 / CBS 356.35 / IMI 108563 / JCM 9778 / NBRC 8474) TaxID=1097556 RepID=R4XK33_TAPDE|nr:protein of unknown function [Taphrina deformans PYCC 5710]|eukprot:CCG83673.1 protein of unknown function [Taphrina deformans PYCC 5710]
MVAMKVFPTTRNSIAFFSVTIVMAVLVMGLEGYIFARYEDETHKYDMQDSTSSRAIPTYFSLVIFAEIFGLLVAWDSLRLKNTIQVIGLCLYHLALMVYAIIQIDQIKEALGPDLINDHDVWGNGSSLSIEPWLIIIPVVIGCSIVLLCYYSYRLYEEFGWTIYKHIGADLAMHRHYMAFQIFIALLKFDFIFFVGFTIQFIVITLNVTDPEFGLTIAVIPITILGLLFTSWALRNEKMWGMYITLTYFLCAMAYFLFKLIRMYSGPKKSLYGSAKRPLVTFAILTLALLIASIVNASICMRNFGKGLKNYVHQRRVGTSPSSPEMLMDRWISSTDHKSPVSLRVQLD